MKPILRSLAVSTAVVVAYPFAVFAAVWPLGVLWGGSYYSTMSRALLMPLAIPDYVVRTLYPAAHLSERMPIEFVFLMLGWFIAFNTVIYYLPIRLFLQWRDRNQELP